MTQRMTPAEQRALTTIQSSNDPRALRQIISNARGKSPAVEQAAFRRLVMVSTPHEAGTLEHDCWAMIYAVEELRRVNGRRVSRMNRMRPKIEAEGEAAALEYCALNETAGFQEILDYGMAELTAEAIVLKHASRFAPDVVQAACLRLEGAGIDPARFTTPT